ncbi:MAG: DsbA family protein [Thermoleophilia bacterium]
MNNKIIIGIIAAAVVAVGVLVGITLIGGDDDGGTIEGVAATQERFAGLQQSGNTVGNPDAPVEIIEYGDISCPACRAASESTIPELLDGPVADGTAKLTFRPIAFINASSERGALGAEAAAMQDAIWPFVEVLYKNQGPESEDWLTDAMMLDVATQLGLDATQWEEDYQGDDVATAFFESRDAANGHEVTATPTFVVVGPGGEETVEGVANLSDFEDAIAQVQN